MSKTLANLRDDLSIKLGDYLHQTVTTALAANNNLVDTLLANVEGGTTDNFCKNWWVLVTSEGNDGEIRRVSTYTASTKTIVTLGAAWSSDGADLATYELHKHHPTKKLQSINIAARKSELWADVWDLTLVSNNALPNSSFDWFAVSTVPYKYALSNATASKQTSGGYFRGGEAGVIVTASAGNGYLYITSESNRRLLDLQGQTIDFECWVRPSKVDDVAIVIYTLQADGTEQTLTSTGSTPAQKWTKLQLLQQDINPALDKIEFRFKITTNAENVRLDNVRVLGDTVTSYLLPETFKDGVVTSMRLQTYGSGTWNRPADDIGYNFHYEDVYGWEVVSDGTDRYLNTPTLPDGHLIELRGSTPLNDTLSADTDTMDIESEKTEYLIAMAARELYMEIHAGNASYANTRESSDRYEEVIVRLDGEIAWLKSKFGKLRTSQMRVRY